jgi:uncharacterized membrane protein YwzB
MNMVLALLNPDIFTISRLILFFVAVIFIFKAMQAIDYSKIFRRNTGDEIRFLFMVVAIILGHLFVDAIMSLFEYLNELF